MRRTQWPLLGLAVGALFPALAAAEPLAIDDAVREALARAPEVRAAAGAGEAASARVEQAQSAYLPRITVEAAYQARTPKNSLPITLPAIPGLEPIGDIDDIHHFRGGVQAGFRLLDLSRRPRVEAAEAQVQAESSRRQDVEAKLAFGVRAAYLAALFARETADIATASLEVARAEEERAQLRVEGGMGTELALAQARVRVAELLAQQTRAENELLRFGAQLASLLGRDAPPEIDGELATLAGVDWPVSGGEDEPARRLGTNETLGGSAGSGADARPAKGTARAPSSSLEAEVSIPHHAAESTDNPEAARYAAESRAAALAAKSTSRSWLPTLSLMASAELQYPRAFKLELGPVYTAGAVLSWPVFDGFARDAEAEAQEAASRSMLAMSDAARDRAARQQIDLRSRARTAESDLSSARRIREENAVYLRVAQAALEAGAGTELEVHTARLALDAAAIAEQRALLERALVRAEALLVRGLAFEGGSK